MVITQTEPETVFNALRLALYAVKQGDEVRIFLYEIVRDSDRLITV